MYVIRRHINGITLNDYEYILEDDSDKIRGFPTPDDAASFLNDNTEENLTPEQWEDEYGVYIVPEDEA